LFSGKALKVVSFYNLANLYSRMYAFVIDQCLIISVSGCLSSLLLVFSLISTNLYVVISTIMFFLLQQGYFIYFEYKWGGQTPGKRTMQIRVAHINGFDLQLNQIIIRNLVRVVDCLPFFGALGGIICFFSNHNQRLGDMAAATIVLDVKEKSELPFQSLPINKFNSMTKYPHLCAKLRKVVSPEEVQIVFELLHRKKTIESDSSFELYDKAKAYFQKKVAFPEEDLINMSAEQYLINLVNILSGRKYFG
jgi:uncharacterized RDD family membrane protein YckC